MPKEYKEFRKVNLANILVDSRTTDRINMAIEKANKTGEKYAFYVASVSKYPDFDLRDGFFSAVGFKTGPEREMFLDRLPAEADITVCFYTQPDADLDIAMDKGKSHDFGNGIILNDKEIAENIQYFSNELLGVDISKYDLFDNISHYSKIGSDIIARVASKEKENLVKSKICPVSVRINSDDPELPVLNFFQFNPEHFKYLPIALNKIMQAQSISDLEKQGFFRLVNITYDPEKREYYKPDFKEALDAFSEAELRI